MQGAPYTCVQTGVPDIARRLRPKQRKGKGERLATDCELREGNTIDFSSLDRLRYYYSYYISENKNVYDKFDSALYSSINKLLYVLLSNL